MKNLKDNLVALATMLNNDLNEAIEIKKLSVHVTIDGAIYAISFSNHFEDKKNKTNPLFNVKDLEENVLYSNLGFNNIIEAIYELESDK